MPNYKGVAPWYSQRKKIKKVVIENEVTSIGNYAFYGCSGLTSVTIPNSVTSIGNDAFYGCSGLTSVTIPNSVTSIGRSAFSGCSGLTSLTIPNSVTSIGDAAFYGCKALTYLTIPNSVTSIGIEAFYYCEALTSINVDKGNTIYDSREDCNALIETKSNTLICGCKNTTIPNSVTSIGEYAFSGCSGLTSVTIPNSVTSIGESAFEGCSGLTSLTLPNSVTSIESSAFKGCFGLTSITIPNSVTSIGYSEFYGCSGLTSITIPNAVTSIEDEAFAGCSDLTSVTIPNAVTSIGEEAFYGCSGLTYVTIGNSVTSIGSSAFLGAKLRNIVIKAKTPPSWDKTEHYHGTFSNQTLYHATLMVPEGSWDAYVYNDDWYQFINIREVAYNADKLTNSKAYMLKSSNEGSYLFYDSVNDCVASLNETALDDTEENNTWMTTEVDGKHYVYNLGARKFLVADKTNAKTGYRLSDVPASIDIEDGKDAIVFGKSKEFYMVVNNKLNVDENLESQIIATTGIKGISVDANQPTVTYSVNGQIVPDNTKGLRIKNGKKIIIK